MFYPDRVHMPNEEKQLLVYWLAMPRKRLGSGKPRKKKSVNRQDAQTQAIDLELKQVFDPEHNPIDAELQEAFGSDVNLEALIEFGQQAGGSSAMEALEALHSPVPAVIPPTKEYGRQPENEGELSNLMGTQVVEKVTKLNSHRFIRGPLPKLWWFPINELLDHPAVGTFRDVYTRQRLTGNPSILRMEFSAFLTALDNLRVPEWLEILVFSDEPKGDPRMINFVVVATKSELEGQPVCPPWLEPYKYDRYERERRGLV